MSRQVCEVGRFCARGRPFDHNWDDGLDLLPFDGVRVLYVLLQECEFGRPDV